MTKLTMSSNGPSYDTLLRLPAVRARTGLGRSSIYRLIDEGLFPRPVQLRGTTLVAWAQSEIDAWITERVAAPRGGRQRHSEELGS